MPLDDRNDVLEMLDEIEGPSAEAARVDGVILPGGKVTFTASARALYRRAAKTETLFFRGGTVQRVRDGKLQVVKPDAARSVFEDYAQFWAWRVGKDEVPVLKETVMPQQTAAAILACDEAWKVLPKITGLCSCPLIVADGEIVGKGYHAPTGLFITDGEAPPEMELTEAIKLLRELVEEFDFQSLGDRSRALASFHTPALKMGGHLKRNIPADVAEANKSQSGKTYRQRLIAAAYGENPSMVAFKGGGVGHADESLAAQLVAGRPFVQFDNFRGKFDSPYTEALLTAEKSFPVRLPFTPEVMIDPSRFVIMLSSNGVDTTRDFANRSSIVRNRKKAEGFKFTKYKEGDLLEHVRADPALYLGAIFRVVKEWIAKGRLTTDETRHDFREWCQTLDWIVQNILEEAPLMDGHLEAQVRVSNPDLTFLRKIALAIADQNLLGEFLMASQLYEIAESAAIEVPGLRGESDEGNGKRVIGVIMGRIFKDAATVRVDEFDVTRDEYEVPRDGDAGGYTARRYQFRRTTPE
jgi:hypothetical protein